MIELNGLTYYEVGTPDDLLLIYNGGEIAKKENNTIFYITGRKKDVKLWALSLGVETVRDFYTSEIL